MTSPLENLAAAGELKREPPDAREYRTLIDSGRIRLRDAESTAISLESRFDLAYNAAHALSLAALRRSGYRSENRYMVFQALAHTLAMKPSVWRVLADAHRDRNAREYRGVVLVTERLVDDVVAAAKSVLGAIEALRPSV